MTYAIQNWPGDCKAAKWLGRAWSEWISLDDALPRRSGAPLQAGLYRIRARGESGLLYIGETGSIRGRFRDLRRAIGLAKVMKTGSHWAGPCIYHHEQQGETIELSWLVDSVADEADRKGLEAEYVAAHRWQLRKNPECSFVAMPRRPGAIP
jgi:hypothetical protein